MCTYNESFETSASEMKDAATFSAVQTPIDKGVSDEERCPRVSSNSPSSSSASESEKHDRPMEEVVDAELVPWQLVTGGLFTFSF